MTPGAGATRPTRTWPMQQHDRSAGAKLNRFLWRSLGRVGMRFIFSDWYALKSAWLRLFGAKIGEGVCIRPGVVIHEPRNLTVGEGTWIAENAKFLCLAPVTIGAYCRISQYTYLCTGSHDVQSKTMRMSAEPITIEDECWLAADVYIGPGVTVGRGAVVGARSSVYKSLPGWGVYVGNPARKRKDRPEFGLAEHHAADAARKQAAVVGDGGAA